MLRKLATAALTAALILTATPVHASPTGRCISGQCGQVVNWGPGRLTVKTTKNQVSLAPNTRTSTAYDWDAVFIPQGKCVTRHGPTSAVDICAPLKSGGYWTSVSNTGVTIFSTSWN